MRPLPQFAKPTRTQDITAHYATHDNQAGQWVRFTGLSAHLSDRYSAIKELEQFFSGYITTAKLYCEFHVKKAINEQLSAKVKVKEGKWSAYGLAVLRHGMR